MIITLDIVLNVRKECYKFMEGLWTWTMERNATSSRNAYGKEFGYDTL